MRYALCSYREDYASGLLTLEIRRAGSFAQDLATMEYHYTPLQYPDAIRLVTLVAGETSAPIQISISEVRSKDNPEYEALSYTWATEDGDDARSSSIECGSQCIWITRNCEAALRRLRNRDADCTLWVDAICIDQRNIHERGHQVGLMRDIYSKAKQVLIWLGESSKDIDEETGISVSGVFLSYVCRMAAEVRDYNAMGNPERLLFSTRNFSPR